jgi:antitoxin component of MazEF toxin-antitoxin module
MEYTTNVKRIGGSAYLRLPPKLVRERGFKDKSEVLLRESDDMIIMDTNKTRIDKAGKKFLNMSFNLGGKGVSREEIYETDRY